MNPITQGAAAGGIRWLVGSRHALMARPSKTSWSYSIKLTAKQGARIAHGREFVKENSVQVRSGQYIERKYACRTSRGEHYFVIEAFFNKNTFRGLRKSSRSLFEADRKRTYHDQVFPLYIYEKARQVSAKYLC